MARHNGGAPVNPYGNLPIIGPWISKLGQIHNIYATPCTASPEIWVKAAFVSLPRLAYLLAKPFLIADQWHARTGRGHRRAKGIVRLLAQGVPKTPLSEIPGWQFFKVTGDFVLKIEWYLMIVDRTLEFLVNTSSMVYTYAGCQLPGGRWAQVSRSDGTIIPTGVAKLVGPMFGFEYPGVPIVAGTLGIPAGFSGVVNWSFSGHGIHPGGVKPCDNFTAALWDFSNGFAEQQFTSTKVNQGTKGGADSKFIDLGLQPARIYGIVVTGDDGWLAIDYASLSINSFRAGEKGLLHDP